MKKWRLFVIAVIMAIGWTDGAQAQNQAGKDAANIQLFHQMVSAGCIYQFRQDPKGASIPPELRDNICYCVDKWFQDNNLNTVEAVKANEPIMPQVVGYCVQVAVRQ